MFDLMFLAGTTPDYNAPRLTDELVARLLHAFDGADQRLSPSVEREALATFLIENRDMCVLIEG